jgi:hypothetical protein
MVLADRDVLRCRLSLIPLFIYLLIWVLSFWYRVSRRDMVY